MLRLCYSDESIDKVTIMLSLKQVSESEYLLEGKLRNRALSFKRFTDTFDNQFVDLVKEEKPLMLVLFMFWLFRFAGIVSF
jgi:hypothetical protein